MSAEQSWLSQDGGDTNSTPGRIPVVVVEGKCIDEKDGKVVVQTGPWQSDVDEHLLAQDDVAAAIQRCKDKLYDLESETEGWAERLEMLETNDPEMRDEAMAGWNAKHVESGTFGKVKG